MIVTTEMKTRVADHLMNKLSLARNIFGAEMDSFNTPNVIYKKRGTTAGTADYRKWEIDLNSTLLMENDQLFIDRTVTHELAHLITHHLYPMNHTGFGKRSPHGSDWKHVMMHLGAEPSRCHSYDTTNSKVQKRGQAKHKWTCNECGVSIELGSVRHNKMLMGAARYWKRGCSKHHTYEHQPTMTHVTAVAPKRPIKKARYITTVAPTTSKLSKKVRSFAIFKDMFMQGHDRAAIIKTFIVQLHMTKAGASTYYANAHKALA